MTIQPGLFDQAPSPGTKSAPSPDAIRLLTAATEPRTLKELMGLLGASDRTKFRTRHIRPLLADGLLAMTQPDHPRSSRQRYVITDAGRELLAKGGAR